MRNPILLAFAVLLAATASAQHLNHPPVVTPLPNLTLRPGSAPLTFYLTNNFSDPDVTGLTGTQVRIDSNSGPINIELYDTQTPLTVANYLHYVTTGLYNNVFINRSIPGFVVQAGGFKLTPPSHPEAISATPLPTVHNEPGISNIRGTLAMAKPAGMPNGARSEWFINLADNGGAPNNLDSTNGGYTVFGRVIEGDMFLVDAVSHTETFPYTNANYTNLPLKNFTANDFLAGKVPLADNYFLFNDVVSGPKITLSANSDNTGIVNPVITGTTLTLTPNMTGTATLTVSATDFNGLSATSVTTVSVDPNAPIGKLANISTRSKVQTGEAVMIGGFIVAGTGTKRLLIRVLGSELAPLGVPSVLQDAYIQVFDSNQTLIAINNTWNVQTPLPNQTIPLGTVADISASGHAPTDAQEPAVLLTLPAGAFTVVVQGLSASTGNALVEIDELDSTDTASLSNISTRGSVGTVNDVMIGGFIVGGTTPKRVIVRGIGPTLGPLGIVNPLLNPSLQVFAGSVQIAQNDDWQSSSAGDLAAIMASGRAPSSPQESAVILTLPPGAYTAILRGVNSTTGVGLIEVYDLD